MPGYTTECKDGEKCDNFVNLSNNMNNANKLNIITYHLTIGNWL